LIPGVGDVNGKKLISYCGSPEAVFSEKRKALMKIPGIGEATVNSILSQKVLERAEKEIAFIEKYNIQSLYYTDKEYPLRLRHCIDSPILLYYKGNADLNAEKVVGIVGTRRATEYGKESCKNIVEGLADIGVLVVSGLAYGIDTCSHKAALKNNLKTVGVVAHGLDRIYPYDNKSLAIKMQNDGGIITEFLSESIPDRENFPQRNRIIAGMVDALIVVESAKRGGALITADIANSYNRDVFAVPGDIDNKYSEGCNLFIKTNRAALIQSADDIKYVMRWETESKKPPKQRKLFIELSDDEKILMEILKDMNQANIDYLVKNSKLTPSKVASGLLNLEFEGVVKSLPGKIYKMI
jgi:DNA processing protein